MPSDEKTNKDNAHKALIEDAAFKAAGVGAAALRIFPGYVSFAITSAHCAYDTVNISESNHPHKEDIIKVHRQACSAEMSGAFFGGVLGSSALRQAVLAIHEKLGTPGVDTLRNGTLVDAVLFPVHIAEVIHKSGSDGGATQVAIHPATPGYTKPTEPVIDDRTREILNQTFNYDNNTLNNILFTEQAPDPDTDNACIADPRIVKHNEFAAKGKQAKITPG